MGRTTGKVALVTGGVRGQGRSHAVHLTPGTGTGSVFGR